MQELEGINELLISKAGLTKNKELESRLEAVDDLKELVQCKSDMKTIISEWLEKLKTDLQDSIKKDDYGFKEHLLILLYTSPLSSMFSEENRLDPVIEYFVMEMYKYELGYDNETVKKVNDLVTLMKPRLTANHLKAIIYHYIKDFEENLNLEFSSDSTDKEGKEFLNKIFSTYTNSGTSLVSDYIKTKAAEFIYGKSNSIVSSINSLFFEDKQTANDNNMIEGYVEDNSFNGDYVALLTAIKQQRWDCDQLLDLFIQANRVYTLPLETQTKQTNDQENSTHMLKDLHNYYFELKFSENFGNLTEFDVYKVKHLEDLKLKTKANNKRLLKYFSITLLAVILSEFKGLIEDRKDLERLKDMWINKELFIEPEKLTALSVLLHKAESQITLIFDRAEEQLPNFKELIQKNTYTEADEEDFEI